ncbi:MAG: hypothetical protein HPY78_03355 [Brevinematales bacterium]|nr:hypothetical protein [Brevinematales bacterium]
MLTIRQDSLMLDNETLPGVIQSISVGGSIIYEKQDDDTKKRKVSLGYDDKTISIELKLYPYTRTGEEIDVYSQLAILEKFFKKQENSIPKVFTFVHPHAKSRSISKVLFSRLESSEDISTNTISVSLEFIEFVPAEIVAREDAKQEGLSKSSTSSQSSQTVSTQSSQNKSSSTPATEEEPKIEWKKNLKKGRESWK